MNTIWLVDAFTHKHYTGNPCAVMIVTDFPRDMFLIAAEMNLPAITFVKPLGKNLFQIRYFTPTVEIRLCGHATLAAAHILFQENEIEGDSLTFDTPQEKIQVHRDEDGYSMDFPLIKHSHSIDTQNFEKFMQFQLETNEVFQSTDDYIIVLMNEAKVRSLMPNFTKIAEFEIRGMIFTAPGHDYDYVARYFSPRVGVNEDSIGGLEHCKLASYWSKRLGKKELSAYQASVRGGTLKMKIDGNRVALKGKAITTMKGQWRI